MVAQLVDSNCTITVSLLRRILEQYLKLGSGSLSLQPFHFRSHPYSTIRCHITSEGLKTYSNKSKGKIRPITDHEGPEGVEV